MKRYFVYRPAERNEWETYILIATTNTVGTWYRRNGEKEPSRGQNDFSYFEKHSDYREVTKAEADYIIANRNFNYNKTNMKAFNIKCNTVEETAKVAGILLSYGYIFHRAFECKSAKTYARTHDQSHKYVGINDGVIDAWRAEVSYAHTFTSIPEMVEHLETIANSPKPVELKLNNNYTATITAEGVQVGCQTFSFDIIESLHKACQAFK